MPRTRATTVSAYLASQSPGVRATLTRVRRLVKRHLPAGYREAMNWGAITYEVPLRRYPNTYNGQPLCYAALAAQKNYASLYLMGAYGDSALKRRLQEGFRTAGKRLNMGKSCIRFRSVDDLALDVIGEVVAAIPVDRYVAIAEAARNRRRG